MEQEKQDLIAEITQSINNCTFIKITLGKYRGEEGELEQIHIREIKISTGDNFSFVYRYKTRDITKNFPINQSIQLISKLIGSDFLSVSLFTTVKDFQLEYSKKMKVRMFSSKPSMQKAQSTDHNRSKQRFIDQDAKFLVELDVTDVEGSLKEKKYDKYQQINKFIETFSSLYKASGITKNDSISIVDFGCGKGYLTFAIYHYFTEILKQPVNVTGIDIKQDLIDSSNKIAINCNYKDLQFINKEIKDFSDNNIDVVIALHACDTATDDAIAKGIKANASIIILSPCCHKYLKNRISPSKILNEIFKHGILNQRMSEIITDSLRALTLEYYGYKTQIVEFISAEHTGRNIMITAVKTKQAKDPAMLEKINKLKIEFGLEEYYLDKIKSFNTLF